MNLIRALNYRIDLALKIKSLGTNWYTKLDLFFYTLLVQTLHHFKLPPLEHICYMQVNETNLRIKCQGTQDELFVIKEIFLEKIYEIPNALHANTIIDLGANSGIASLWFITKYPEARIFSYEPNLEIYEQLEENIKPYPSITVYNTAVASEDGTVDFYISKRSIAASLFLINKSSEKKRVSAVSLDTAIELVGKPIDILKVDIEGAEFEVLEKAKRLKEINFIIGELHGDIAHINTSDIIKTLSPTHIIDTKIPSGHSRGILLAHKR